MLMSVTPSDGGKGGAGDRPNNSSVPPEIFELLSPEMQELTQYADGEKEIARSAAPPRLSGTGGATSKL